MSRNFEQIGQNPQNDKYRKIKWLTNSTDQRYQEKSGHYPNFKTASKTMKNKIRVDHKMLSAYLDGELTEAEKKAVEEHLVLSAKARALLSDLEGIREAFAQWKPKGPNPFLADRISERIAEEAALGNRMRSFARQFVQRFALVAMLLVVAGALIVLNHHLHNRVELITLEAYLEGALDRDLREVSTVTEADLSKDLVLDLVLSGNVR